MRGVLVDCVVPGAIDAGRAGRARRLVASPACSLMTGATLELTGGRAVS